MPTNPWLLVQRSQRRDDLVGRLCKNHYITCGLFLRELRFCRGKLVEDPLTLVLVKDVTQLGPLS